MRPSSAASANHAATAFIVFMGSHSKAAAGARDVVRPSARWCLARHGAAVSAPVPSMRRGGGGSADEGVAEMRVQPQVGLHRAQQGEGNEGAGESRAPPGVESGHGAQPLSEGTEEEEHGA